MLSVIPQQYLGFRFDLATSTNNDGINAKQSLFYDGLHPIESGCAEMAKRLFADVDILKWQGWIPNTNKWMNYEQITRLKINKKTHKR